MKERINVYRVSHRQKPRSQRKIARDVHSLGRLADSAKCGKKRNAAKYVRPSDAACCWCCQRDSDLKIPPITQLMASRIANRRATMKERSASLLYAISGKSERTMMNILKCEQRSTRRRFSPSDGRFGLVEVATHNSNKHVEKSPSTDKRASLGRLASGNGSLPECVSLLLHRFFEVVSHVNPQRRGRKRREEPS